MVFEDKHVKSFLTRLFNSGGLAMFFAIIVFFGIKNYNSTIESLGIASIVLLYFGIRSGIWCRIYVDKVSINDEEVKLDFYKFSKRDSIIINREKLRVELNGVAVKGKMYKLLIFEEKELKIVQYQSEYWTNDKLVELFDILSPPPAWRKIK